MGRVLAYQAEERLEERRVRLVLGEGGPEVVWPASPRWVYFASIAWQFCVGVSMAGAVGLLMWKMMQMPVLMPVVEDLAWSLPMGVALLTLTWGFWELRQHVRWGRVPRRWMADGRGLGQAYMGFW